MGIVIKESISTTVISYVGVALGAINMLWLFPKYFSSEEIGLLKVLVDVAFTILPFAHLGSANVATKFFSEHRTKQIQSSFFTYLLLLPTIGVLGVIFLFIFFRDSAIENYFDRSPLLAEYVFYILPMTVFVVFAHVIEAYIKTFYKTILPNFLRAVYLRLFTTILVFLYAIELIEFNLVITLFTLSYATQLVGLLVYLKSLMKQSFSITFGFKKNLNLKTLRSYGVFMILGSGINTIITRIDVLMTASLLGLGETGIYSIALYMAMVIDVPRKSISQISTPILSNAISNNNFSEASNIYKKASINQLIIGSFIFLLIWLNIDSIFSLMPNSSTYASGKYVVLFIGLSRITTMTAGMTSEFIQNSSLYKWNFYASPVLLTGVIVTNLIFIPKWGITGAAATTFANIIVANTLQIIIIYKKFNTIPFSRKHILALIPILICMSFNTLIIFDIGPFLSVLVKSIIVSLVFVFSIRVLNLSEEINSIFKKLL